MLLSILLIAVSFIMSTYLFRKCAGTLHIGRLNLISVIYYLFMVQVFAGVALIMLGFDHHYTLSKLINRDASINTMFYVTMATAVAWPLCMLLFIRLFKIKPKLNYSEYLLRPTLNKKEKITFPVVIAISGLCLALLAVYLYKIGFIPLLKLLQQPKGFSFATARITIDKIYIVNIYVRNILILLAVPLLSYVSFGYALATREKKWIVLAIILFIASVITKTYDFEKAPIIFHMMVYVLIFAYQKGGIKTKWMIPIIVGGFALLFAAYALVSNGVSHSIYDGIGGRLLFSQVGAFAYNFDLFPNIFPFLMGRSFSPTVLKLFGVNPDMYLRSARLTMEYYSHYAVYEGTAGVMNSFYLGEAYANFGWIGAGFSVIWTGFVISGFYTLMIRIRKTPVTVALAAYLAIYVGTTINGGFVDFIYNISWIISIGGLLLLEYLPDIAGLIKKLFGHREPLKPIERVERIENNRNR